MCPRRSAGIEIEPRAGQFRPPASAATLRRFSCRKYGETVAFRSSRLLRMPANLLETVDSRESRTKGGFVSGITLRLPTSRRPVSAAGRLILVECADMGRLDLVLRAAARYAPRRSDVHFATPVGTRHLPAGGGKEVSRSDLRLIEAAGDLLFMWCEQGRCYGYTGEILDLLGKGTNVVVAVRAGSGADVAARRLCRDVSVMRLEPGTDTLRHGMFSSRESPTIRVRDTGDVVTAIRAITAALVSVLPAQSLKERKPRSPNLALRETDALPAPARPAKRARRQLGRAPLEARRDLTPQARAAQST